MISHQVNRILCQRRTISQFLRMSHSDCSQSKVLFPLGNRKLMKISGSDASVFLQGLITNDMGHFEEGAKSMYAMFLNNKGRVLYDTLIHRWEGLDSYLIECDRNVLSLLEKHLKMYKLRRRVEFEDVNKDLKVWVLLTSEMLDSEIDPSNKINIYRDPRISDLGYRILSSASLRAPEVADNFGQDVNLQWNDEGYKYLRYQLGVSEGAEDLPPASSLPLEVNCDYLHGVSFHKGCYVGQELTARVHHTGVVRKRIMPLKFVEDVNDLENDIVISASSNPKSNLGKLKGYCKDYGLGLLRIKEALDAKVLVVGNHSAQALKPSWWPLEAPKDKVTVKTE